MQHRIVSHTPLWPPANLRRTWVTPLSTVPCPKLVTNLLPKGSNPAEYIIYDLWESMREHDRGLADEVLEPTFVFMRSQTDRARLHIKELGEYLQYREKDVGKAYVKITQRSSLPKTMT